MKVPNCENALVPLEKITEYLLNHDHPDGSSKAIKSIWIIPNDESIPKLVTAYPSKK